MRGLTCSIVAVALGIPEFVALGPDVARRTKSAGLVATGIERPAAPVTPASDNEGATEPDRTRSTRRPFLQQGSTRNTIKGRQLPLS